MSAGSIPAGEAYVEIGGDNKPLGSALSRASSMLDSFASQAMRLGATVASAGAGIMAPILKSISKASAYEETLNKFNVIFEDQADATRKWGEAHADTINRSRLEYIDMLGTAQSLFRGMGIGSKEAAGMSKQMVALASDMGSFWDMADADAWTRLASGIVGETEAVRRWGIDLSEAAMKQELVNKGIKKNYAELSQSEKVQMRVNMILAATTKQQGDATNTAGSYANSLRGLWSQVENLAVAVGNHLLPVATRWINKATEGIKIAIKWARDNETLVKAVAELGVALTAVGAALLGVAAASFALSALLTPLSGIVIAVGLVATAILTILDALGIVNTGFGDFISNIRIGNITVATYFKTTWNNILADFLGVRDAIISGWEGLVLSFRTVGSFILSGVAAVASGISSAFWTSIKWISDKIAWLTEKAEVTVLRAKGMTGQMSEADVQKGVYKAALKRSATINEGNAQKEKAERYYSDIIKEEEAKRDSMAAEFHKRKVDRAKATEQEIKALHKENMDLMKADIKQIEPEKMKEKMTKAPGSGTPSAVGAAGASKDKMEAVGSFFNLAGAQMIGSTQPDIARQTTLQEKMVKSLKAIEEKPVGGTWGA